VSAGVLALQVIAGTPLDDFLEGAGGGSSSAETARDLGATVSMAGLLLALGVVVFLARVHRGRASEVRTLLLTAGVGAVALLVGAVVELAGIQVVFDTGWADVLSVDVSSAPMLRMLAGVLVVTGLGSTVARDETGVRWVAGPDSTFGLVGLGLGALSFGFDGHTVTQGPRGVQLVADLVHVAAGAVWVGGVISLVIVMIARRRSGGTVADLVVRFSPVATAALVAVAVAGGVMAAFIVDGVDDLTGTVWGRRLIVKLVAVAGAAVLGAYHHLVTTRRLAVPDTSGRVLARARTTLVIEALMLAFVVIATGYLVNGATL
jgi:copper transport protein